MATQLKTIYYTAKSVEAMAEALYSVHEDFDRQRFLELVLDEAFLEMEFKEKMHRTTECLFPFLPQAFPDAIEILKNAAPQIKSAEAMCLPDYVEHYGLEHWDLSMDALAWFTRFGSSEFAIRPFILKDPQRAMAYMLGLTKDEDHHVRRFASEGCRPRLPWAMALPVFKKDPTPIVPVLEALKDDDSEYVRKSVANNLNDISKDHPEIVLDLAVDWLGSSSNTDWIVKHACRTMLKAGSARAMGLFGFSDPKDIVVTDLVFTPEALNIGSEVRFDFVVKNKKAGDVRLEYKVHYVKARGKITQKVFKISERKLTPGEHPVSRKQSFVDRSTRTHYPGRHEIEVIVNGVSKARGGFQLTDQ